MQVQQREMGRSVHPTPAICMESASGVGRQLLVLQTTMLLSGVTTSSQQVLYLACSAPWSASTTLCIALCRYIHHGLQITKAEAERIR